MLQRRYTSIAEEPELVEDTETSSLQESSLLSRIRATNLSENDACAASFPGARRKKANEPQPSTSLISEDSFEREPRLSADEDDVFIKDDTDALQGHPITRHQLRSHSPVSKIPEEVEVTDKLTAHQIREIKEAFNVFDNNGDGCISATELKKLVTSLGYNITEAELMDMMNQIDSDGNGAIDFPEFLGLMTRNLNDVDKDDILLESFKVFDRDNSGTIGTAELHRVMKLLGQDFRDFEIQAMIKAVDIDGDGAVNYEDFKNMMNE